MRNFIRKILPLAFVFTVIFTMTAFASDFTATTAEITSQSRTVDEGTLSDVSTFSPAAPVTDVFATDLYIQNGRVFLEIAIIGYGDRRVTLDGRAVTATRIRTVGNPVYAFIETYDLGPATAGTRTLNFRTTSFNSPWNTITETFTVTVY